MSSGISPLQHQGLASLRRWDSVRRAAFVTLVLLLLQFGLGMAANLYVTIPARHPGGHGGEYLGRSVESVGWALGHGAPTLAAHAALGFLLVLAALGLLAQAMRLRHPGVLAASLVGLAAIVGAGFSGASFLDYGKDVSSLIMALLFALAVFCYTTALFLAPAARPQRRV